MKPPPGVETGGANIVLRLLKALYGTKQAPMEWNGDLNETVVLSLVQTL